MKNCFPSPAAFREKYESEMTLLFRELASDALRQRGLGGLFLVWLRVFGDLLRTVPKSHFEDLERRIIVKTSFRVFLWSLLATAIHLVIFYFIWCIFFFGIFVFPGLEGGVTLQSFSRIYQYCEIPGFLLPPFFVGMILARVQPFYRPYLTAPLGIMAFWGLLLCLSGNPIGSIGRGIAAVIGIYSLQFLFVGLIGLMTLLGCVAAAKLSQRWSKHQESRQIAAQ